VKAPQAVPVLLAAARGAGGERVDLRKAAVTALLTYEDEAIGNEVAAAYPALPTEVRPAALNLLASRPGWAPALIGLVERGAARPAEVPPDIAARLRSHADERVAGPARKFFPESNPQPGDAKHADVRRIQQVVEASPGDPYQGESLFMQRCAACHTLFHKGGRIGPDLTGYQRDDLRTMLPSILDPNAEVREGYRNYTVTTKDGRTLGGFLVEDDPAVVTLRGFDGQDVRLARPDITEIRPAGTSLMPEGLLDGLTDQQLRDFFAYLRIPQPITP